ncbi:cell division cycle and apoptosis regulator protein 1-like [Anticarsia gemmatalis]|uniref:cell division cycle and apoptosis regulator protein 1-like n=1 Tax=Anticarsia gemmatalis TaxID=129554 RepID=UPI003F7702C2
MQSGSGAKNPPWARSNVNTNMTGMNPQIMDPNQMMSQQGMMQFQQTQVFNPSMMQAQSGMAMPMAGQMPMNQMAQGQMYPGNVVAYPTPRAMNPGMYQNAQSNQSPANAEQRVFTGTVTKTHNDFGFVDHDVFYQTSVCAKGIIPKVNDRVLVEATYNPNMPFKWNATRVQVLPKGGPNQKPNNPKSNNYNAVPPPANKKSMPSRRDDRPRRDDRKRSRTRSRSRSRDVRDSRNRRDSPPRKRPVVHQPSPIKYVVRVPRIPLDIQKMDVPAVSQRYTNLYVPSDFFNAQVTWGETFPPQAPFSINNPCAYHIMSKEIENPNANDAVLEPPDADYRFSAKVMLISMPTLETLYQKCGLTKVDEKDKRTNKTPLHPTRLIKFLVGQKGKGGENFAIGGPWSPSLDGENPQSDPKVLVKTAIRTCKALTGIDLSSCAQWYRMVEFYYWREGSGGKSRLECVVLFLPDVWSAQASRVDWATVQEQYKAACESAVRKLAGDDAASGAPGDASAADKSQIDNKDLDSSTITIDENDDDDVDKPEPTHYSKLDLRTIKVDQLRQELRARNVSCKGLRSQLVSRLSKLVKSEEAEDKKDDVMELEDDDQEQEKQSQDEKIEIKDDKEEEEKKSEVKPEETEKKTEEKVEKVKTEKEIEEEKRKLEKEKSLLKTRYEIPTTPHILVHPSNSAKGGKFNCNVATLSLLLDYRITDNKEHSFELFVFAELFNEMLMRDFGFYIYKTLYTLPEKAEEVKEKSDEKSEKKPEEKKDEKKEESRPERRDDRRDSRRRDRKESPSDDERSSSPKRRSRGVELPPDPYLLLSLVYFDTSRGGSMTKKDLQNLFMSLGLQLSRSQIRAVLEKVCIKDSFNYKTLMQTIKDVASGTPEAIQDLPLDTTVVANEVPSHIAELEETIAAGNRNLLPIFNVPTDDTKSQGETKDVSDSGMVMYKSRLVDVGALVAGQARGAAARGRLEAALESTRAALRAARAAAASTQQAERGAMTQLSDLSASLNSARARIASLTASSKIFHSALKSIQSKVEAVVNIKYEDDDVVEIVNGPSQSEKTKETKATEERQDVKDTSTDKDDTLNNDKKDKDGAETEDLTVSDVKEKESDITTAENMDLEDKE